MTLGAAIYDIQGLTYQGALETFWTQAEPPRRELWDAFIKAIVANIQIRGVYYKGEGMAALARCLPGSGVLQRLEARHLVAGIEGARPGAGLEWDAFIKAIVANIQIRGVYYKGEGMAAAVEATASRLECLPGSGVLQRLEARHLVAGIEGARPGAGLEPGARPGASCGTPSSRRSSPTSRSAASTTRARAWRRRWRGGSACVQNVSSAPW
jgi:hypothetical protein